MININEQDFNLYDVKMWGSKLRQLGFKRLFGGHFSKNTTDTPFRYKQYQFIATQTLNLSVTRPKDSFYSISFLNTSGPVDIGTLSILDKYFDRELKGFLKISTGNLGIGVKYTFTIEPNSNFASKMSDVEKMFYFASKMADQIIVGAQNVLKSKGRNLSSSGRKRV